MIDTPGVYEMSEAAYLTDPVEGGSLSASGAKLLMEAPAKFDYRQHAGEEHRATFDFGKAAHSLVLGIGAPVAVLEFDDWRTKAAQAAKDEAHVAGSVPVLAKAWAVVEAMADAIRRHPIAAAVLDPARGRAEQTVVWHDRIWRRARIDFLPDLDTAGRLVVADYKTAADASSAGFSRSAASYGYHMQDAWYGAGVRSVSGRDDVAFVFVVQEKDPPFLVNVVELTDSARRIGSWRNEIAVDRYMRARESGIWPGYADDVGRVSLPRWAEIEHEEQLELHNEGSFQ